MSQKKIIRLRLGSAWARSDQNHTGDLFRSKQIWFKNQALRRHFLSALLCVV